MKEFIRYQHVEKLGTDATEGIDLGECYVFPKIDGTNASLWFDGVVKAGSRNRELSTDNDNAGFLNTEAVKEKYKTFFAEYPDVHLFGEWLVPHSLKSYRDETWRKFYVFDVVDGGKYIPYSQYKLMLEKHGIDFIPPIAILKNGSTEQFMKCLEKNNYLISDGQGVGEGVVIKRYDFVNRFGHTVWAKIVTSEFKERHTKTMGAPIIEGEESIEEKIIEGFCTEVLVKKEYAKLCVDGWQSKKIPQLLDTVFYCLVNEELWSALKKFKNPVIDFGKLKHRSISKIRQILPEVF